MDKQKLVEQLSHVRYALYLDYGIGAFKNWLSMRDDKLSREDVVKALRVQAVRKLAVADVARLRKKADELEDMLKEASEL